MRIMSEMRVLAHGRHVPWRLWFEDLGIFLSMHVKASDRPVMQPENRMIHEQETARYWRREFDHSGAARRNQCRLQTTRRRREQVALAVHLVENLSNHMERGNQIGAGVPHVHPH